MTEGIFNHLDKNVLKELLDLNGRGSRKIIYPSRKIAQDTWIDLFIFHTPIYLVLKHLAGSPQHVYFFSYEHSVIGLTQEILRVELTFLQQTQYHVGFHVITKFAHAVATVHQVCQQTDQQATNCSQCN